MNARIFGGVVAALLALSGCSAQESLPGGAAQARGKHASQATPASFVNQVWVVLKSKQVATGSLRVFLSEGTLVMADPHSTPALGTWNYQDGRLTITEEGLKYNVEILELTEDTFRVRIHSPGEPIEIRLEPAEAPPLPGNPQQLPVRR